METGNGTSRDLQISSATNLSGFGTTRDMPMNFTACQMSSKLASGTGAPITCHSNVGPFIAKDSVETGNGTSTSLQISSATNMSRSGTTRDMQINFSARQMSNNLASGTGATLTYRSNVGPFIPEDCVEAGNGASIDFQISPATDMSRSGTTRDMQISFTGRQTSSNIAGGTGATLKCHADDELSLIHI